MMKHTVLCEIATEIVDCTADSEAEFVYSKRRWRIKSFLAEHAAIVRDCVNKCQEARTKTLCFKELQLQPADEGSEWTLVLLYYNTAFKTRPIEMQIAAMLLPKIFANYLPSLEFELMEQQHQRVLKSYVTTQLYDALYRRHEPKFVANDSLTLPTCFKSKLRQYQERTVQWMVSRERQGHELSANWTALLAVDGRSKVYKHNHCLHFYDITETHPTFFLPPGGILADEMGLGKTVELLALVLLNPRPTADVRNSYWCKLWEDIEDQLPIKRSRMERDVLCICSSTSQLLVQCNRCQLWQHKTCVQAPTDEFYVCPNCWTELAANQLVESKTTFIVSPNAIKMQWYREISEHISPSLKVLLYPGVHSAKWFSPMDLAQYDIVLTDYSILRTEIYHTREYMSNRSRRHKSRFMRPSSPLLMVKWWRVCLDEAQMVESNTSNVAAMVMQLPAINRWAVTGTPIQRSIDDLIPLLHFVGFDAAIDPLDAWQTVSNSFLLKHKTEALLDILQPIMWRTCKSKVEDELGIPPQTELVHRLSLSNVESLYYREEHSKCSEQFVAAVAKHTKDHKSRLASISPKLLKLILNPFLRIRQTCTVPAVRNGNVSTTEYLNPQDLLVRLKSANELECKSQLRTWASSYNGMAAIYFIKHDYQQAISYYKLVLKLAQDYNEEHISVDSVLQIHALDNIMQASSLAPAREQLTNEELTNYQMQLKKLEWKYLEDNCKVLLTARRSFETKLEELEHLRQLYKGDVVELLATLVAESAAYHESLWNKVRDELMRQNISAEKLQNVRSVSGLVFVIDTWYKRLRKLKENLDDEFEYLKSIMISACDAVENGDTLPKDASNFISSISDCHLADILDDKSDGNTEKSKKKLCRLCSIRDMINKFECLLFAKEMDKDGAVTDGLEKPSIELCLVKVIFSFLRSKAEISSWQAECQNKLETLNCLQNLCKLQIKYWIEVEYVVKAFDELTMCKMRILLTDNPDEQSTYRVLKYELNELMQNQLHNVNESQLKFTRLAGRLKYLKHLKEDANDKACPICQTQDDARYVVMVCGHFICQLCLDQMKKASRDSIRKCPICRQVSPQLYYSVRAGVQQALVGEFSSKIAYIVRLVLRLKAESTDADELKVLIFSQWQFILKYIAQALNQNYIKYRDKCTYRDIAEFKDPQANVTCLLIPLARGSKGLNLIEATHVFLVEPILNPGEELQAIGRVHRFGQKKPTMVHRFIVNGTIEENIMQLIASADDKQTLCTHWDLENMTLDSLEQLFKLKET